MGDDIKTVVLTGGAAESMNPSSYEGGATRKKKGIADKKIVTKVGAGMSPGTLDQLASTRAPGPLPPALEPRINIPVLGAAQPIRIGGSSTPQKVILAKTSRLKKVFLAPSVKSTGQAVAQVPIKKKKTMKRIRISIGGKQIIKAKTIRNKSSGKTLSEVKASLAKAGLINPDTKAPEEVLRGMHGDLMVLKKRAL